VDWVPPVCPLAETEMNISNRPSTDILTRIFVLTDSALLLNMSTLLGGKLLRGVAGELGCPVRQAVENFQDF